MPDKMTHDQVQWAAQFAVGAELARRGYSAAFFLGNHPRHDLLCTGETGSFGVQVKGFACPKPKEPEARGNYVLIQDLFGGDPEDVFVIVHVPQPPGQFEFYIATRTELRDAHRATTPLVNPKNGADFAEFTAGVCYKGFKGFKDRWEILRGPHTPATADRRI